MCVCYLPAFKTSDLRLQQLLTAVRDIQPGQHAVQVPLALTGSLPFCPGRCRWPMKAHRWFKGFRLCKQGMHKQPELPDPRGEAQPERPLSCLIKRTLGLNIESRDTAAQKKPRSTHSFLNRDLACFSGGKYRQNSKITLLNLSQGNGQVTVPFWQESKRSQPYTKQSSTLHHFPHKAPVTTVHMQ